MLFESADDFAFMPVVHDSAIPVFLSLLIIVINLVAHYICYILVPERCFGLATRLSPLSAPPAQPFTFWFGELACALINIASLLTVLC